MSDPIKVGSVEEVKERILAELSDEAALRRDVSGHYALGADNYFMGLKPIMRRVAERIRSLNIVWEQGWVSVEERLPQVGREVFVFTKYATMDVASRNGDGSWSRWSDRQYGHSNPADTVTYWRLLPSSPSEEKKLFSR